MRGLAMVRRQPDRQRCLPSRSCGWFRRPLGRDHESMCNGGLHDRFSRVAANFFRASPTRERNGKHSQRSYQDGAAHHIWSRSQSERVAMPGDPGIIAGLTPHFVQTQSRIRVRTCTTVKFSPFERTGCTDSEKLRRVGGTY